MIVDLWFHGVFREIATRRRQITLTAGASLGDLIERLAEEYGSRFSEEMARGDEYFIMLNGNYCRPVENRDRLLDDKDVVAFVPITVGG